MRGEEDLFIGIDLGGSAVKASVFDSDGRSLGHATAHIEAARHQSAGRWLDAIEAAFWAALREVIVEPAVGRRVGGIGISAACPTPVIQFADGRSANGFPGVPDGAAAVFERLHEEAGIDGHLQRTGNTPHLATMSALTGLAVWQESGAPSNARFGHLSSLAVFWLTGEWVIDPTHAAATGLLDIDRPLEWSRAGLEALEFPQDLLPRLAPSDASAGGLRPELAETLGLRSGIVVAVGGADTACAALGIGCVDDGSAFESTGTSGVMTVCRESARAPGGAFNRPHVVEGRWLSHWAMSFAGGSLDWFCQSVLGNGHAETPDWEEAFNLSERSQPGAGGVLFLPYLEGERSPVWDRHARGAWVGLRSATRRSDLARAVLEAGGYGLRQFVELEHEFSTHRIHKLPTIGGGSVSDVWCQLKADIADLELLRPSGRYVAARGAANLALRAWGGDAIWGERGPFDIFEPDRTPTAEREYDRMYRAFVSAYDALKPLYETLRAGQR
jgi:xylulokinase